MLPKTKTFYLQVLTALGIGFICIAFAFPFVWMICAGFKTDAQIFTPFPVWPQNPNTHLYRDLFMGTWIPYPRLFLNSLFIAISQTALSVTMACGAGYVFGQFEFRFKKILFALALLVILIPRQVLLLPLFTWMNTLSLLDTPWAVILPGAVSGLGFLYFTALFKRFPGQLLDMTRCEGAGELRVFFSTLPLIKPGFIAFALIQFVLSWQDHLIPLVMLSSPEKLTVTIGLASLEAGNFRVPYGLVMAGCTLTLIPTVLLYAFTYRHFRSALSQLTEA